MRSRPAAAAALPLLAALFLLATPASAQETATATWQQVATHDMEQVEGKYVQLADAIPETAYGWRPSEGVRSVGEVFTHVAAANYMFGQILGTPIPGDVTAKYPNGQAFNAVTNKAEIIAMLRASFAHAKSVVSALPAAKLDTRVPMFGREAPAKAALLAYMTHNHEHLGQSIAYARSNKVTPPWSAGN